MQNREEKMRTRVRRWILVGVADRGAIDANSVSGKQKLRARITLKGFTMVEFSMSLAFISVLLMVVAGVIVNITTIYQKGITTRDLDEVGRAIVDDMTEAIEGSTTVRRLEGGSVQPGENGVDNGANTNYFQQTDGAGVFCPGEYSYVWNLGGSDGGKISKIEFKMKDSSSVSTFEEPNAGIKLVKIKDPAQVVCESFADNSSTLNITKSNTYTISEQPEELIVDAKDTKLMIYNFSVFISQDSLNLKSLVSGSFILGTDRGGIEVVKDGEAVEEDYCSTASGTEGLSSDFTYCALNEFNFSARMGG